MKPPTVTAPVVMTIGHSTRSIEEFVHLLRAHGVQRLVDVRTVPRSRHNPQFNREDLGQSLESAGLHYSYLPGLGGFRRARRESQSQSSIKQSSLERNVPGSVDPSSSPASLNAGWRNASFRAYADYMQSSEFEQHLNTLIELASAEKVAIMCAEAVPWRCHRSLIADALTMRGIEVREITGATTERLHVLTPFARVEGTRICYPARESQEEPTLFS